MTQETKTTSRMAILAIVYKAVKTVGDEYEMALRDQIDIAEGLGDKVVEVLALAGSGKVSECQMPTTQLDVYDFFNDVFDLLEQQLPFVTKYFNVTLTTSRFAERNGHDDTPAHA